MEAFAQALQASPFGLWASGSVYPYANLVHLLGLVMLVGGIGVVDLRLAGWFGALPPAALSRALTPIAVCGLLLMLPSGAILFAADAGSLATSDAFRLKLVLIGFALANAAAFRLLWHRRLDDWDNAIPRAIPRAAQAMAVASLLLWLAVGMQGRMIAYS